MICGQAIARCGPASKSPPSLQRPSAWSVNGVSRANAFLVSRDDQDRPVYGGTPADFAVVQAIQEMKSRGLRVTFYPFILMDVPPGNTLPNPYSDNAAETGQPAFPWRGRITCSPAAGYAGTVDKTGTAATQVSALFGAATPASFSVSGENVSWTGPSGDWGLRRMVLHYAHLCAAAGGVDAFLIGTEMPGLTTIRSGAAAYPAVQAYRDLLADVRSDPRIGCEPRLCRRLVGILSGTSRAMAAATCSSTSIRSGPTPTIDFVGIDNYMPLSDWRDGFEHADAAEGWPAIYDRAYLQGTSRAAKASTGSMPARRTAPRRSAPRSRMARPAKPWVFRYKDLRAWWSNAHYDRPAGSRARHADGMGAAVQADLVHRARLPGHRPGHQPAQRLLRPEVVGELHAAFLAGLARRRDPARLSRGDLSLVGRGREQPDLRCLRRPDGACAGMRRLDLGRAALSVLSGADRRLDRRRELAARPLADGRLGAVSLAALVRHLCLRAGLPEARIDVTGLWGAVEGYAIGALESPRASITTLSRHFGFDAVETEGVIRFVMRGGRRGHPCARRSGGRSRRRRVGTDARAGDRTAAGAEVAGGPCRRGLRRRPRRGAPHHRGHDPDCLGELSHGGPARGS